MMDEYQGIAVAVIVIIVIAFLYYMRNTKFTDPFITPGTNHESSEYGSGEQSANLDKNYADLIIDGEVNDHSEDIKKMALEDDVSESHKEFVKDITRSTSGAAGAAFTLRSDDNDVNPRVGLRRSKYRTYASARSDARVVHSEYPDQMYHHTAYTL